MKLGSTFPVPASRDRVFAHFLDPDSMRACVPGCSELVKSDDTHFRGALVNEIAHVRFSAAFSAEITSLEAPARVEAVLRGEDRKLSSSIKVDATLAVHETGPDSSSVEFGMDLALWGTLGRLGESIVRRRSEDVQRQFVEVFSRVCAAGPPGADNAVVRRLLAPPAEVGQAEGEVATRLSWWRRLLARLGVRRAAAPR
ncbi:CoxG family protein [Pseudonocardia spinosispora]|uniref:CoxG family protein n=1 Tax=Pseudonocardia spinosispora TaxID=103441 RepID=UPI000426C634|nr:SRPBCC domain-containing protein [Pseudonocardia spinosispora]